MYRTFFQKNLVRKSEIKIIQVNIGNKCNQSCKHCHLECSPYGNKNMNRKTAEQILKKIIEIRPEMIDITGGAPEMNKNLSYFIKELSEHNIKTAIRTNLTILDDPEYNHFIDLYRRNRVKIIASLPSLNSAETDKQRGQMVFEKSIKILKKLNDIGYGKGDLELDLVQNPIGDYISDIKQIEKDYRETLYSNYGITFDKFISITNIPIGRFREYLLTSGNYEKYLDILVNNFNYETVDNLMCKKIISIDYEGFVYDCDFNLALNNRIKGYENIKFWEINFDDFNPIVSCGEHCFACTVRRGSSCYGTLIKDETTDVRDVVKYYYSSEVKKTTDLKTGACCSPDSIPSYIKDILLMIEPEIIEKYYGCGSPIPTALDGLNILDIGCGTGLDCYVLSKLVGAKGHIYGIDMTEEQIAIAKKYISIHTERFGYSEPNITFIQDYIENINRHFRKESIDLVISNCVVNLIEDKETVLKHIYDILKTGGEFYFSDIYSDRRIPEDLRNNKILYGECLGGALYWRDFERIAKKVGFLDPRIVSKRLIDIKNEELKNLVGNINFYTITYRLWKIEGLEDACEDYGHIAVYKGNIKESFFRFVLDNSHIFEKDKPERICGNTALMLSKTRFKKYFEIIGDFKQHFGQFNCNKENKNYDNFKSCC
jgi:arsenite methyltransferase